MNVSKQIDFSVVWPGPLFHLEQAPHLAVGALNVRDQTREARGQ